MVCSSSTRQKENREQTHPHMAIVPNRTQPHPITPNHTDKVRSGEVGRGRARSGKVGRRVQTDRQGPDRQGRMHTHTCTRTRTRTHTHKHTHTHTPHHTTPHHTPHAHARTHAHTCTRTRTRMHAHTHTLDNNKLVDRTEKHRNFIFLLPGQKI